MKRAIISDIHGNLEALQAVLADIDRQGVDDVICLGDVVGYGPNPCECVKLVRDRCSVVILGNHDQGALFDPDGFNSGAERAIRWTRRQIELHDRLPRNSANLLSDFLGELSRNHVQGDFMYVHGSARRPLDEYVFPEDIYNPLKLEHIFELVPRHCFQGHTHIPGMFTTSPEFMAPGVPKGETEVAMDLPAGKAVELKPGGYHVMLMDLKGQVKEGQSVPLTLVVEGSDKKRQSVEVKAQVRALNQAGPGHAKDAKASH